MRDEELLLLLALRGERGEVPRHLPQQAEEIFIGLLLDGEGATPNTLRRAVAVAYIGEAFPFTVDGVGVTLKTAGCERLIRWPAVLRAISTQET